MCGCEGLVKAIDAYIAKADDDLEKALKDAGYADPEGTVKRISSLEDKVALALLAQTDYVLDKLKESVDLETFFKELWPKIKAGDVTGKELQAIFVEEFQSYMKPLASKYVAKIDEELTVETISKQTTGWVRSWSKELSGLMKLKSHKEIEEILEKGLAEGQSVADVTRAIQDSGIRNEYYKARRVAITETLRAHSVASQEAMMQNPSVEEKEWLHTGSYRNTPRPNHVAISGQRVPKSKPYTLTGKDGRTYKPMYPRDSILPAGESVNCHCISQPIVSKEALGMPIEERRKLQAKALAELDSEWEKELDAKNRARAGIE